MVAVSVFFAVYASALMAAPGQADLPAGATPTARRPVAEEFAEKVTRVSAGG